MTLVAILQSLPRFKMFRFFEHKPIEGIRFTISMIFTDLNTKFLVFWSKSIVEFFWIFPIASNDFAAQTDREFVYRQELLMWLVIRKSASDKLKMIGRTIQIIKNPLNLTRVADHQSVCEDGFNSICLSLHDGSNVRLTDLCSSKTTDRFWSQDSRERFDKSMLGEQHSESCWATCTTKLDC